MITRAWRWLGFALALSLVGSAWAADLPRAQPEKMGFSSRGLAYIDEFYADKVNKGELAGIVTLVARHGKVVHLGAVGYADVESRQKLRTDSIFRLYSMTKPITSTALMMLYQEGRFQMNDPLSKYIPEFADLRVLRSPDAPLDETVAMVHAPTIQDLLRHTAGFSHGLTTGAFDAQYTKADLFGLDVSLAEMMSRLAKIPLRHQPGTKFFYSLAPDIQARLVEVLSGMPFDEFLQKRLFGPLGMTDTSFWLPPGKIGRLATVHWVKDGKLVPLDEAHGYPADRGFLAEPWSVNSYGVDHKHKGGSIGLVGTAENYWRFAQMMLNGGEFDGTRILSPEVVRYMTRDHLGTIPVDWYFPGDRMAGLGFGLGFAVMKDSAAAGYMSSAGTFFWAGAAETHFWIDPKEDIVVVALTQHMGVPAADELWVQLRTLVYSALTQ